MLNNPKTVLHTFRSNPCGLFVLIALFMPDCPDPVGEKWLARRTGYTRKTVRESGLYFLEDLGIIHRARHRRGWSLTEAARQLPLPFPELPGAVAGNVLDGTLALPNGAANGHTNGHKNGHKNGEGKIYPHGPTTTATTTYSREKEVTAAAVAGEGKIYPQANGEGKVYPHESGQLPDLSTAQTTVVDYLRANGIGDPTCSDLAQLDWVTLDYATAHLAQGRANDDRLALVIHRMRSHDPAPVALIPPEDCPDCGRHMFDAAGNCLICSGRVQI